MNKLIQDLLKEELDIHTLDHGNLPQYHALQELRDTQYHKISAVLGRDFVEEVWSTAAQLRADDCDLYFEKGFRLAGQLFLAMLV